MRWLTRYRWHEGVAGRSFSSRPDSAWSASFTRAWSRTSQATATSSSRSTIPMTRTSSSFPTPRRRAQLSDGHHGGALGPRRADTRFVLSELARLGRAGFFAGRLDLGHVGMFGHSLAGAAAASTMLVDPRIDAGADLDGVLFEGARTGGLSRPFMLMSAEPGFAADPNRAGFWSRITRVSLRRRHQGCSPFRVQRSGLLRASADPGEPVGRGADQSSGRQRRWARDTHGGTCLLLAFFDRFLRESKNRCLAGYQGPSQACVSPSDGERDAAGLLCRVG